MAQQQRSELVAMKQGAPHGAHVQPFVHQVSRACPFSSELYNWKSAADPRIPALSA